MSFILDALKKSETDRQQRRSAEFAGIPTSGDRRDGPPAWMWIVGALLIVNLAVLVGILLQPRVEPADSQPSEEMAAATLPLEPAAAEPSAPGSANDFTRRVVAARENQPVPEGPVESAMTAEPTASSGSVTRDPRSTTALPNVHEVQARGLVSLPPLHVDIHVYSENAEDRFVFVNMVKHKEGSRLVEGPLVSEITPEGVVLEHNGTRFLLPRD
jgi:general secretion pathway protein B